MANRGGPCLAVPDPCRINGHLNSVWPMLSSVYFVYYTINVSLKWYFSFAYKVGNPTVARQAICTSQTDVQQEETGRNHFTSPLLISSQDVSLLFIPLPLFAVRLPDAAREATFPT